MTDGKFQPGSLDKNGILNTLLYTQMLRGNTLPNRLFDPTDAHRGNWFTDTQSTDPSDYGTFAIHQDFWLKQCILPELRVLNAAVEGRIDDPELHVYCDPNGLYTSAGFQLSFGCGTKAGSAAGDSSYDLKHTGDVPILPFTNGLSSVYSWSSHFTTNRNPDWSKDDANSVQGPGGQQYAEAGWHGALGKTWVELTSTSSFLKDTEKCCELSC